MKKEDLQLILNNHIKSFGGYALNMYKNYFMYNGDMYSKLVKEKEERRSAIVSPTTHTYVNSTYNMLLDNIVTVDMRTVPNASDREADEEFLKEVTDIFIPYMEEKEGYVENMHSSMFDTVLLGCTSASLGWSDIDEKITYMSPSSGSIEGIKLSESYPVREYKGPFDNLFYGSKTHVDKRFFVSRKLISKENVKKFIAKNKKYLRSDGKEEINIKRVLDAVDGTSPFYCSTADYESIKQHMAFVCEQNSMSGGGVGFNKGFYGSENFVYSITDDDAYNIKNKMIEVIEVNSVKGKKIYVAGEYLGTRHRMIPISGTEEVSMKFKEIPGSFLGLGIGTVAAPIQKAFDDILNPRIDSVIMAASPMYIQNSGASLFANKKTMRARPGIIHQSADPKNALIPVPIVESGSTAYRETDALLSMGNGATGINNLSLGMQQKVERVSGSVALLKASTDNAMNPLMQSIRSARGALLKRALILAKISWDKKRIDKVFGEGSVFAEISLEKLVNNYDFIYNMTSEALESKTADITQLMKMLDFIAGQEQQGKKVNASSDKIAEIILSKLNIAYGDLSVEANEKVMQAAGDPGMGAEVMKATTGLNDKSIEKGMREMQGTGVGDVPPEFTTNAEGVNFNS